MNLRPIVDVGAPGYPAARRVGGWLRRTVAAAGVSIALASLGSSCASGAPQGEGATTARKQASQPARNLEWCEPQLRLSGDRSPANHFTCVPAPSGAMPVHAAPPGVSDGQLCGSQPAWAHFNVASALRASLTLASTDIKLRIYAPDGAQVAELGPQRQCLALDMEPGIWVLAALPAGNSSRQSGYFEFFFDRVGPP